MSDKPESSADQTPADNDPTPVQKAMHQYRMRHDWRNLIDDLIQDGQEKGVFDNLKGKGKPLNLSSGLFGEEKKLAHELLKDNKLTPVWINNRNQVIEETKQLRHEIQTLWVRYEREFRIITDRRHRDNLTLRWDDACLDWEARISKLNKLIDDYNLKRPISSLELYKLSLERELNRSGAKRWLR